MQPRASVQREDHPRAPVKGGDKGSVMNGIAGSEADCSSARRVGGGREGAWGMRRFRIAWLFHKPDRLLLDNLEMNTHNLQKENGHHITISDEKAKGNGGTNAREERK